MDKQIQDKYEAIIVQKDYGNDNAMTFYANPSKGVITEYEGKISAEDIEDWPTNSFILIETETGELTVGSYIDANGNQIDFNDLISSDGGVMLADRLDDIVRAIVDEHQCDMAIELMDEIIEEYGLPIQSYSELTPEQKLAAEIEAIASDTIMAPDNVVYSTFGKEGSGMYVEDHTYEGSLEALKARTEAAIEDAYENGTEKDIDKVHKKADKKMDTKVQYSLEHFMSNYAANTQQMAYAKTFEQDIDDLQYNNDAYEYDDGDKDLSDNYDYSDEPEPDLQEYEMM